MTIRTNLQHHNEIMVAESFFAIDEAKGLHGVLVYQLDHKEFLNLKHNKFCSKILM